MRRGIAALLAVGAGGAVTVGVLVADGGRDAAAGDVEPSRRTTATVERRTLVARELVDGALGYADERPVATQLKGTLTWRPGEGAVIEPGEIMLEVDGQPVVLLDGSVPAYRALEPGDEGEDVRQLERGLRDLGLDPGDTDGEFDAETASAVRDWQSSHDLPETGRVELGRIVFLPGERRVSARATQVGEAVRGAPLHTTSTRRIVTLDIDAGDQDIAREGAKVEVELPDGAFAPGRIARVGRVANAPQGEEGGEATVEVVVRLTGKERGGSLDQAPVSVELARERRRGVLAVPVTALVAQRGGGYGVEVVGRGGERRLVEVTPGLFADGLVEVEGGVREGDRVAVPAT